MTFPFIRALDHSLKRQFQKKEKREQYKKKSQNLGGNTLRLYDFLLSNTEKAQGGQTRLYYESIHKLTEFSTPFYYKSGPLALSEIMRPKLEALFLGLYE